MLQQPNQLRIQSVANKYGKDIAVVGGNARGSATSISDWDYVVDANNSIRNSMLRDLPKGTFKRGSSLNTMRAPSG